MEQDHLEQKKAVVSFGSLVLYMYCKQNTKLSLTIRNNNHNIDESRVGLLVCHMMYESHLSDMPMINLLEDFGNNQRKSYDSVGDYLEKLFERCEKFARQEKWNFYVSRFKFFARLILLFVCHEVGFGFTVLNYDKTSYSQIIILTLFGLGSVACLVCSFVFTWGIFWNALFAAVFLCRTWFYYVAIIKTALKVYRSVQRSEETVLQKKIIDGFNENKGSIKKHMKRIGELERRRRLQNELIQREGQQSVVNSVVNNVKSDINDVPLMVVADGKVEIL